MRLRDQVAAAVAVVDDGMAKPEAMERFGIASATPLKQWCRLYRGGGAEALRPRPRGRPRSGAKAAPTTREQELEREVRRLEAQVAYPRKSMALKAELRSRTGRRPQRSPSFQGRATASPASSGPPASPGRATTARCPIPRPRPAGAARQGGGDLRRASNGVGHRQVAMELRAVDGARIAGKTVLRMMGEMGSGAASAGRPTTTGTARTGAPSARCSRTRSDATSPPTAPGRRWAPTSPGSSAPSARPTSRPYDFGSKEIVAWSVSERPGLAQQEECARHARGGEAGGAGSPVLHSDMGWQCQHASYVAKLRENGFVQSMSRRGNCIDNGATEQVFGHLKDEFFRGRDWSDFESFKRDLEAYIRHWNHVRRQSG